MNVHYIQHVPYETPGNIETYFRENKHQVSGTHIYSDEKLPLLDSVDCLVVMGGHMNVHDTKPYPWLAEEKKFIKKAMDADKKIIGICLGAQLIVDVLGGEVFQGAYKEIGWLPIVKPDLSQADYQLTEPMVVFHWHGDTFELPPKAELIYVSEPGIKQGYTIDNQVLGLQCHLEMTKEGVASIVANGQSDLAEEGPFIQSSDEILGTQDHYEANKAFLYKLLDEFMAK